MRYLVDFVYFVYTIYQMDIEFDPAKSARNARDRGLPFDLAYEFDFETASIQEDTRYAYPEVSFAALGFLAGRLHVLCFTPVENGIRVISFRKVNTRERKSYEHQTSPHE